MIWRIRLGAVLLVCLVSGCAVCSFSNNTLQDEIPETYANISGRNALWNTLLRDCRNPTVACIQNTMYRYLNNVLEHTDDYELGGFMKITKNNATYDKQTNEIDRDDGNEEITTNSPLEEVTGALQDKAAKFMMTHDMQLNMPDTLFDGAILQVSPRQFEDSGFVAKFDFLPRSANIGTPRIFFKKFKKFIGEKLMNALLAVLLVVSMVSVKFMFFMPMVMGVAAAKKLLLKLLLFFFPFLAHLFKLCPYYETHGGGLTKFHHHHHQIAHLHHIPPPHPHIVDHNPHIVDHNPHILDHNPHIHEHEEDHSGHYEVGLDYYSEGPGATNDFIHRKTDKKPAEENDIYTWLSGGQGQEPAKRTRKPQMNRPLTPSEVESLALKAEKEAVLKVRLQQEHQRVLAENKLLQEQIKQGLKMQEKLRLQASIMQQKKRVEAVHLTPGVLAGPISGMQTPSQVLQTPPYNRYGKLNQNHPLRISPINSNLAMQSLHNLHLNQNLPQFAEALPLQTSRLDQAFPLQTHQIGQDLLQTSRVDPSVVALQPQGKTYNDAVQEAAATAYDAFYSPILEKIDKILVAVGFTDEPCRERLICSMYKNPEKFSPHSNLLSAQLSRDASELQKPTSTNAAVIRFYRYVQAARDGQDKRECLRLYPSCVVNTEL